MGNRRAVPAEDLKRFFTLLERYGVASGRYALFEEEFVAQYGPRVCIISVIGPTEAVYSRTEGNWLEEVEAHLRLGWYR